MRNLSPDEFILEFLKGRDFTSPSTIGEAYGRYKHGDHHYKTGYHSAWASPRCKRMVRNGELLRNELGHYRLPVDAEQATITKRHIAQTNKARRRTRREKKVYIRS